MKRKYYFVILFLLLTMFFIIDTSSVNAIMYKILDSERNIIRITSNPVLSIKEIEAGCIILSASEGITISTQDQITNGQEKKQETSSGNEKYDFRKTNWGMNKEQVKATEKGRIIFETESEVDFMAPDFDNDFICGYLFLENKLYTSLYSFIKEHINKNDYIDDYEKLKEALTKKYGKPKTEGLLWKNDLFKDNKQEWGTAISIGHLLYVATWETSATEINIVLVGDNYKIDLTILYNSKELKEWAKKIIEKETSKGL